MKNAEWMLQNDMRFSGLTWAHINGRNIVYYSKNKSVAIEIYSDKSVYPENLITKWLDMEHREKILDDVEKRYLSSVIRPFRDRINYICKIENDSNELDFIYFRVKNSADVDLPNFEHGTMYKGMKPGRKYTLEELGI